MLRSFLAILFAMLLVSCEETNVAVMTEAATDAVTAITLTDADVRDLARRAVQATDEKYRIAPPGNPYDERLRRLVAGHSRRDGYTFNFKVYLTGEINAFAMADGSIRVCSGLMDLMSDAELLFVIGHEMGHVVQNHSRKQVVLFYTTSALRKGLASQESEIGQIAASVLGSFAEQLTHAQFSQHEERQADQYGAAFLKAEGYGIAPAVSALDKLAALARRHTFLSSHPDPEARAKRLLGGGDGGDEDRDSLLGKVLGYGEKLAVGLFNLARSLVKWLISLW